MNYKARKERHIGFGLFGTCRYGFLLAVFFTSLCTFTYEEADWRCKSTMLSVPSDHISALGINLMLTSFESPADAVVCPWVWIRTLFLGAARASVS
ncbi:hypothetical protein B0H19DRAFT_1183433 [Mycena capillaripes]|nr:hypothetical protein B0H19DRAFT_1183433 [Mycena capillaripes]